MLLMVEKCIERRIYHAIHEFIKANNKYMKDYDKNKESPYHKCWDVKNLYGWVMSQTFAVDSFKQVENISQINKDFIKNCNKDSDVGYFPCCSITNLHEKNQYVILIKNLKQPLNHGLVLKKMRRVLNSIKNLGWNHTLIWIQPKMILKKKFF